jgi:hypothetical protein
VRTRDGWPSVCAGSTTAGYLASSQLDGAKLVEKLDTASGAYLQNHGLNLELKGGYDGTSMLLERVE